MNILSDTTCIISLQSKEAAFAHFLSQAIRDAPRNNMVYAMAGIPGSGKSTFVQTCIQDGTFPANAFILNPDMVMEALLEYRCTYEDQGAEKAFQQWEQQALTLAYLLLEKAIELHTDIIIDMGGARSEHFNLLLQLKKQGYVLNMYWLDIPLKIAKQRIQKRIRFTPVEMLIERQKVLKSMKLKYRALVDRFTIICGV